MARPGMPARDVSHSVLKAIRVLRAFTPERPARSLTELAMELGLPRTVCRRLLKTLESERFVERDAETGRYRLGLELFRLGSLALERSGLRSAAGRPLTALARQTGDVICLVVEQDLQALCVERVDGDYPLRNLTVDVGVRKPLHYGAASFALLSFLPEEKIEQILSRPLDAPTSRTVVDPVRIRARIMQVRRRGYAVSDEDSVEHTAAIGAPVFDYVGNAVAGLSVGGLKHRFPAERVVEVAALVMTAAAEISARLGYVRRATSEDQAAPAIEPAGIGQASSLMTIPDDTRDWRTDGRRDRC